MKWNWTRLYCQTFLWMILRNILIIRGTGFLILMKYEPKSSEWKQKRCFSILHVKEKENEVYHFKLNDEKITTTAYLKYFWERLVICLKRIKALQRLAGLYKLFWEWKCVLNLSRRSKYDHSSIRNSLWPVRMLGRCYLVDISVLSSSCLENFHTKYLSIPAKGLNAIFPAHRFPAKLGGQDILPALQQGGSWFPAASIHVENTAQTWKWKTGLLLPQKPICAFPWQPRTECSGGDRFVFTLARLVSSSEDNAPADTESPPASSTQLTSSSFAALMGRRP